jgi:hypothetical protein
MRGSRVRFSPSAPTTLRCHTGAIRVQFALKKQTAGIIAFPVTLSVTPSFALMYDEAGCPLTTCAIGSYKPYKTGFFRRNAMCELEVQSANSGLKDDFALCRHDTPPVDECGLAG